MAEEADDHFGALARERPQLLSQVSELKAEHAFRTVSAIRSLAADSARGLDVAALARKLISDLRRHEDKENRLMQELVLRDGGAVQD